MWNIIYEVNSDAYLLTLALWLHYGLDRHLRVGSSSPLPSYFIKEDAHFGMI
jgi:hypothetical protein